MSNHGIEEAARRIVEQPGNGKLLERMGKAARESMEAFCAELDFVHSGTLD